MDDKIKEIARILDENIRKKGASIQSRSLTTDQIIQVEEFIKSFVNKEKLLR